MASAVRALVEADLACRGWALESRTLVGGVEGFVVRSEEDGARRFVVALAAGDDIDMLHAQAWSARAADLTGEAVVVAVAEDEEAITYITVPVQLYPASPNDALRLHEPGARPTRLSS